MSCLLIPRPYVADVVMGHHGMCMSSRPEETNDGMNVFELLHQLHANDVDESDMSSLSIAVVEVAHVPQGVWQYQLANNSIWRNMPTQLGIHSAFCLRSEDRIRFSPLSGYYFEHRDKANHMHVKIFDRTIPLDSNRRLDTSGSADSSSHSARVATIYPARRGCDNVAGSMLTYNGYGLCGDSGDTVSNWLCSAIPTQCLPTSEVVDVCGVCGGDATDCSGCDRVPYSSLMRDTCGVCNGGGTALDCHGTCFGTAIVDECGECTGGATGLVVDSAKDCMGVCYGSAEVDDCNRCTLPEHKNSNMDCNRVCDGESVVLLDCGICTSPSMMAQFLDCSGTCNGGAYVDRCGDCKPRNTTEQRDACGECHGDNTTCVVCPNGSVQDACGVCGGNGTSCKLFLSMYPSNAPATGGTVLTIMGAGFRSNQYCRFTRVLDGGDNLQTRRSVLPIAIKNPTTATCVAPALGGLDLDATGLTSGFWSCELYDGNDGSHTPLATNAMFAFYSPSTMALTSLLPNRGLMTLNTTVALTGIGIPPTAELACLFLEINITSRAHYINSTVVTCDVPTVTRSQAITVRLLPDGASDNEEYWHLNQTFTATAPPAKILSSEFDAAMTSLVTTFDYPIQPVSPAQNESCDTLFHPVLSVQLFGTAATCLFRTPTELIVQFGPQAHVAVGSEINLLTDTLFRSDQRYSYPSESTIVVQQNSDPIPVTADITAPNHIPLCGSLELSAVHSNGGGHVGLIYQWSVSMGEVPSSIDYSDVVLLLAALPLNTSTVLLPAELFDFAATYLFSLSVSSQMVAHTARTTVQLIKTSSAALPTVVLATPQRILWHSSVPLRLTANVRPSPCSRSVDVVSLTWGVDRCADSDCISAGSAGVLLDMVQNTSVLYIDPAILTVDTYYRFTITVNTLDQTATSMASTIVHRTLPALTCTLGGGRHEQVSRTNMVMLRVQSNGWDVQFGAIRSLWNCDGCYLAGSQYQQILNISNYTSGSTGAVFPAELLGVGTYTFTAHVYSRRHAGVRTSCSKTVTIVDDVLPSIEMYDVQYVHEHGTLSVSMEALITLPDSNNLPQYSVLWSNRGYPGNPQVNLSDLTVALTSPGPHVLPTGASTQAISHMRLRLSQSGAEYILRVTVYTASSPRIMAYHDVTVLAPETGLVKNLVAVKADRSSSAIQLLGYPEYSVSMETPSAFGQNLQVHYAVELDGMITVDLTAPSSLVRQHVLLPTAMGHIVNLHAVAVDMRTRASTRTLLTLPSTASNPVYFNGDEHEALSSFMAHAREVYAIYGDASAALQTVTVALLHVSYIRECNPAVVFQFKTNVSTLLAQMSHSVLSASAVHPYDVDASVHRLLTVTHLLASGGLFPSPIGSTAQENLLRLLHELLNRRTLEASRTRKDTAALTIAGAFMLTPSQAHTVLASVQELFYGASGNGTYEPMARILLEVGSGVVQYLSVGQEAYTFSSVNMSTVVAVSTAASWRHPVLYLPNISTFDVWNCTTSTRLCSGVGVMVAQAATHRDNVLMTDSGRNNTFISDVFTVAIFNPTSGATLPMWTGAWVELPIHSGGVAHYGGAFMAIRCNVRGRANSEEEWRQTFGGVLSSDQQSLRCPLEAGDAQVVATYVHETTTTSTTFTTATESSTSVTSTTTVTAIPTRINVNGATTSRSGTSTSTTISQLDLGTSLESLDNRNTTGTTTTMLLLIVVILILVVAVGAIVHAYHKRSSRAKVSPIHDTDASTTPFRHDIYMFSDHLDEPRRVARVLLPPAISLTEARPLINLSLRQHGPGDYCFVTVMRDVVPADKEDFMAVGSIAGPGPSGHQRLSLARTALALNTAWEGTPAFAPADMPGSVSQEFASDTEADTHGPTDTLPQHVQADVDTGASNSDTDDDTDLPVTPPLSRARAPPLPRMAPLVDRRSIPVFPAEARPALLPPVRQTPALFLPAQATRTSPVDS